MNLRASITFECVSGIAIGGSGIVRIGIETLTALEFPASVMGTVRCDCVRMWLVNTEALPGGAEVAAIVRGGGGARLSDSFGVRRRSDRNRRRDCDWIVCRSHYIGHSGWGFRGL